MSAAALHIHSMIAGGLADGWAEEMVSSSVNMFSVVCMILVLAISLLVIVLVVVPVSHPMNLRTGVTIGVLAGTLIDIAHGIDVDMLTGVDADTWAATATVLESVPTLASSKGASLFGWEACSC